MRKDFGPRTWAYPMPVFIIGSYNEDGKANAMTAAWAGIYDTGLVMVCLADERKTTENIKRTGAFTVSFATANTVTPCDYVGIVSGNDVKDKVAKAGLHYRKSDKVDAPLIDELPMAMECTLHKFTEDGILIGRIKNVCCDESALGPDGLPDLRLVDPIIYDSVAHGYYRFGDKVGDAYTEGKALK